MPICVVRVLCALSAFALLAAPVVAQSSSDEPKSQSVRDAKAKYDAAVKEAEAALAAAKATYLEQLDAAVKAALKAEDLDEANRIDALRKALKSAPAAGAAPAAPAASGEKKPGWIVGSLKDESGKPIKDLKSVTVNAFGTTIQGGQKASFVLEVDENGRFEQEVPDGLYSVTASIVKEFEGSRYLLHLHPDDNKHEQTKTSSKPGIVKHFTWKLTGLRPEYDPKQAFSYYGQSVRVYDARYLGEDNEQLQGEFGANAKAVVTMTPTTTFIDGSKAKPITIECKLSEIGTTLGHVAMDLPIATYRVEAKLAGNGQKLRVKLEYSAEPADSVEAKFTQASEYDSIRPIQIYLSK